MGTDAEPPTATCKFWGCNGPGREVWAVHAQSVGVHRGGWPPSEQSPSLSDTVPVAGDLFLSYVAVSGHLNRMNSENL